MSALDQLADCLTVGIDLTQSLQYLRQRSRGLQASVFASIQFEVDEGKSIAEALANYLDSNTVTMLRMAEQVGNLSNAIRERVKREKEWQSWQSQCVRMLSYPLGLLCACMGLVLFVQLHLQPEFQQLARVLHPHSQQNASIANEVAAILPWLTCSAFVVIPIGYVLVHLTRKLTGLRIFSLPFDRLWENMETEQFVYAIWTQLQAGMTLLEVFDAGVSSSKSIRKRELYQYAKTQILAGDTLSHAIHPRLSGVLRDMVSYGEMTGEMEQSLSQTSVLLQASIRRTIEQFVRYLEPCLMTVMGVVVLAAMYSVFAPMYEAISASGLSSSGLT